MRLSKFDRLYRRIILSSFFTKGWGSPNDLVRILQFRRKISRRDACQALLLDECPIKLIKEYKHSNYTSITGYFQSPVHNQLPGLMSDVVRFEVILPPDGSGMHNKMCLHLAGTGDHGFSRRRRLMAIPLLKLGISSVILENPYYGVRKPKEQFRSSLHLVSDLFVMGAGLILESQILLHWCVKQGWSSLGLTGISMGGFMASLAASNWVKPMALTTCMSWSTASAVYTRGVLSGAIDWKMLENQFYSDKKYRNEVYGLISSPEKSWSEESLTLMGTKAFSTDGQDSGILRPSSSPSYKPVADFHTILRRSQKRNKHPIARHFMTGLMDDCTHLANFSTPLDPQSAVMVVAQHDAYVPRNDVIGLPDIWPGSELRVIPTGHIRCFLTCRDAFISAIFDSFDKLENRSNERNL